MNKSFLIFVAIILIMAAISLSFVPFKKYMVDDRWVYGVSDMREIFPEANYAGQSWEDDNGRITIMSVFSGQEMKLNFWQFLSYKRWKSNKLISPPK